MVSNPGAILFQNSSTDVAFIEVVAIIFHNGNLEEEEGNVYNPDE
jgi:hypothetical protein